MVVGSPFLLHIVPKFFGAWLEEVELVDLVIEPFGLRLIGGRDLATKRPFANKRYAVACHRKSRRALNGIFLDIERPSGEVVAIERWAVGARDIVTHRVRYSLLDQAFDAASDHMILWHRFSKTIGSHEDWPSRWPNGEWHGTAYCEPRMETGLYPINQAKCGGHIHPGDPHEIARRGRMRDTLDADGRILEREEDCPLPTIERGRFSSWIAGDRMPSLESAFRL
jgi:hypothetical protein